jgi:hypothetical protein
VSIARYSGIEGIFHLYRIRLRPALRGERHVTTITGKASRAKAAAIG